MPILIGLLVVCAGCGGGKVSQVTRQNVQLFQGCLDEYTARFGK